jgi:hypothetical protein
MFCSCQCQRFVAVATILLLCSARASAEQPKEVQQCDLGTVDDAAAEHILLPAAGNAAQEALELLGATGSTATLLPTPDLVNNVSVDAWRSMLQSQLQALRTQVWRRNAAQCRLRLDARDACIGSVMNQRCAGSGASAGGSAARRGAASAACRRHHKRWSSETAQ